MSETHAVYKVTPASPIRRLIDVAILMAQELQEIVDDLTLLHLATATPDSIVDKPMPHAREVLADWEVAYAATGLTEDDHFLEEKAAAEFCSYAVGHEIEVEHGEFREYIGEGERPPERTSSWHYPRNNDDLPNMPAPGEIVVLFYEGEDGQPVGPVICTPIHIDGLHILNGKNIYRRCIRWHEIPDEEECPNAIAY